MEENASITAPHLAAMKGGKLTLSRLPDKLYTLLTCSAKSCTAESKTVTNNNNKKKKKLN